MGIVILIVLLVLILGAYPRAGHYSENWGPYPSGALGLVLLIVLVLLLLGYIPYRF